MTTFHIDSDGRLIRATSDPDAVVEGAVETTDIAPESGRQKWNGTGWDALPPVDPADTPSTPDDLIDMLKRLNLPGASAVEIDAALLQAKRNR